jgi:glucose-specific phosphotransferase system IIA component
MFNLFKKKRNEIASPMTGQVIPITEVEDAVFSSKAMGDGFAVQPSEGKVYAPIKGKITSIFPTKHALGLVDEKGLEVLLHIGIDTVELAGNGFDILVQEGAEVDFDTQLATVDLDYLKSQNKPTTTMVIWTNGESATLDIKTGQYTAKTVIGEVNKKDETGSSEIPSVSFYYLPLPERIPYNQSKGAKNNSSIISSSFLYKKW